VSQLRDAHGSAEADSDEQDLARQIDAERTLGLPGGTKRPQTWRSSIQPSQVSPALALSAAPKPRVMPSRTAAVGIVLEPEQDIDLVTDIPTEDSTEFDLEVGFEEQPEVEEQKTDVELNLEEEDGSETLADVKLSNEPLARSPRRPAKSRMKSSAVPQKPTKVKKPGTRTPHSKATPDKPPRARKTVKESNPDFDFEPPVAKKPSKPEPQPEVKRAPEKAVAPPAPPPPPPKVTPPKPIPTRRRWDDDDDEQGRFKKFINSKWGRRTLIPLGAITLLYLLYLGFDAIFEPSASDIAARAKDIPYPVPPDCIFTSEQLWDEYAKDNAGANRKYNEAFVEVSGQVRKVIDDKQLAVILETPSNEAGIVCQFPVKDLMGGIKVGDRVTIQGEGGSRVKPNTDIVLNICKIKPK